MIDGLRVERPAPAVALLTLDRAATRNALTAAVMVGLVDALDGFHGDGATRCVVVTGSPPAFCSGGDLNELAAGGETYYPVYCRAYERIAQAIDRLPCPLVAAVDGAAVGGGLELACLADLRVASTAAFFAGADARLGLPPTSGLSWLLPRLIGSGRARRLLFTDVRIDGAEAHAIGLVEELTEPGEALPRALAVATEIAAMPGRGIELTRASLAVAGTGSHREAIAFELDAQRQAIADPAARRMLGFDG